MEHEMEHMNRKTLWEQVYATKHPAELSWFQPRPTRSLELIAQAGAGPETTIIDIGGGDSTLVDALVERGLGRVTVLDISGAALARAQARLGERAHDVTWLETDVTRAELPRSSYDVWHDRAVFHFLTEPTDRARYVTTAAAALRPGGMLVIATFALRGPTSCSGLTVVRYGPRQLAAELGEEFVLRRSLADVHHTPSGTEQRFTYALFQRR